MSGKLLVKGRIGVDAARAMHKLRDHLLAEPATWLAEVVRAATLSHATRVDITYDADDLFVRFDGDPWPSGVLERAAATLGAGTEGGDRRGYLLAIAAFAALGSDAKRIELFTRLSDGTVESTRVEPSAASAADARSQPKDGQPVTSVCLHAELGFGGIRLGRLVRASRPKEVDLLLERLDAAGLAITINGDPVEPRADHVLLEVALEEEEGATLQVIGTHDAPPRLVFVELGVELSQATWRPDGVLGRGHAGVFLPFRVIVRRERLIANASRSRVEEELERRVSLTLDGALPRVLDALRRKLTDTRDPAEVRRLEDAFGAIAVVVACAHDLGHAADPAVTALAPVLQLPLLWDAVGRRRSVAGVRRVTRAGEPIFLREAEEPLSAVHLPLVRDVMWLRGGAAEVYLRGVPSQPYRAIARDVAHGVARRSRALELPPEPLEIAVLPEHLIAHRFERAGGPRVVVAIRAPGRLGPGCTVRAFVDGKLCETIGIAESPAGIPFDAAIEWPEVIHATRRYDRVVRDRGLERAVSRLGSIVRDALVEHAATVPAHRGTELRAIVAGGGANRHGGALRDLAVWPAVGRGPLSTIEVAEHASRDGGLRVVSPEDAVDSTAIVPTPSPVLALDEADRRSLRVALGGEVALVAYGSKLARGSSSQAELEAALATRLGSSEVPAVRLVIGGRAAVGTAADKTVVVFLHRGDVVHTYEPPLAAGVALAVDDDALLSGNAQGTALEPADHAVAIAVGLAQQPDAARFVAGSTPARALVLRTALALTPGAADFERLCELPLFRVIEDGLLAGSWSARQIAGAVGAEIPVVSSMPEPRVEGLTAVLGDAAEQRVLVHLADKPTREAGVLIERLRGKMARNAERSSLLARAERDPLAPPPNAHPSLPIARLRPRRGVRRASVAMLADGVTPLVPHVAVLFQGREAASLQLDVPNLPITMLVDADRMTLVPGRAGARRRLIGALGLAAACATRQLALELLGRASPSPFEHLPSLELVLHAARGPGGALVLRALELSPSLAPTVQGDRAAFSLLVASSVVRFGRETHAPWPRSGEPSTLDVPILLAPSDRRGNALRALLSLMQRPFIDVSAAVAALVDRRSAAPSHDAEASPEEPPPAHPELRLSLETLLVRGLTGRIDIVDGPSELVVAEGDGDPWVAQPAEVAMLPCSVRGTVRFERGRPRDAWRRDLAIGLGRRLRELASEVDRLPSFVRGQVRRHVVDELAQKRKLSKGVRAARLFPTRDGRTLSLDEAADQIDALDLPLADHIAFVRALGRTPALPPMPDAWRRACVVTAKVARIAEGEVGITSDGTGPGVTVSHLGRTVATVPSLLGFAARGAVEVPTLTRSELETGKLDPLRETAFARAAESALVASIDGMCAPAAGYLARRFVDRTASETRVVGWLWIPEGPASAIRLVTPTGDESRPLLGRGAPLPLPLAGCLFVSGARSSAAVRDVVLAACSEVIEALAPELPAASSFIRLEHLAAAEPASEQAPAAAVGLGPDAPPDAAAASAPEPDTGTGAPPPRLLDGLLALFGVRPTWNAPAGHPLVRRLERVLTRLPIPNGTGIAFSKGGRPVRFEAKRAVVDPENPVVLALLQQDDVPTLAAAILTEANRATADLTDAEERRALVSLLLET